MFVILTRFSLYIPQSNAWLVSRTSDEINEIENYKKKLFNEERLDFRIGFLEKVTLPILEKARKDNKILQIIQYSSNLPKKYIKQLKKIEEKYSFVRLSLYNEEGTPLKEYTEIAIDYFELRDSDKDLPVGILVLDDDDCLSTSYFENARKYLNRNFIGYGVSFGRGINLLFNDNGFNKAVDSYYPKVNIGLMRIGVYRKERNKIITPSMGSHMKADVYLPIVLDSREVSYLWSRHSNQDTSNGKNYNSMMDRLYKLDALENQVVIDGFGDDIIQILRDL